MDGSDAGLGRHHRGCAGARLSEQSAAQRAARLGALHRRERAAGVVGLSAARRGHRAAPAINTPTRSPLRAARPTTDRAEPAFTAPTRRAASALPSRRRCSTDSRPPTGPARRKARSPARAKGCACSNRPCCSRPPPSTWTICATPRSSRCSSSNVRVLEQTLEADPGPLQCRRGHPHRRRAIRSATRRRQDPAADRRSQPDDDAIELPPHHRQRAGSSRAGLAGRSLSAGNAARRGRSRPDAKSQRHRRDVRHRRQLSAGQGQRRRAVADGDAAGLGAAVLRTDHDDLPLVRRLGGRAAVGPGLSGRRRIRADPPVQGNAWRSSASISNRSATRPAPTW